MIWALALMTAGLLIGGLSLLSSLIFFRRLVLPRAESEAVATLLMAATGNVRALPKLLSALERQTLKPRRLIIAVESVEDPAHQAIRTAVVGRALPVELVVAGLAERSAQKCINLLAALDRVDERDQIVVLLDADILPQPGWLSALATPLMNGACDIVAGYRWPIIKRHTLGSHLILAIDRGIAALPRFRWTRAVWGGSVAMRPETVDQLALRTHFRRVLSDDLMIGKLAAQAGLRVLFRRALRVPSPLDCDVQAAWRFGHRQYQLVHLYQPRLWMLALATVATQVACWIAIFGNLDQSVTARIAGAALPGFALIKTALSSRISERLGHRDTPSTLALQAMLCLATPLVDAFHLSMIVAASRVRWVTWGHVRYRVHDPKNILVTSRKPWSRSEP
jgi:hypothetical protein